MSEFIWPARVYYRYIDTRCVVCYANYLKFMGWVRTAWLRARDFAQDAPIKGSNILSTVGLIELECREPVRRGAAELCEDTVRNARPAAGTLRPHGAPASLQHCFEKEVL